MDANKEILGKIRDIEHSEEKLYSYLYDVIYQGLTSDRRFLEKVYSEYLNDERSSIKRIAIYALLYGLQLRKEVYLEKALGFINNLEENIDLRIMSVNALSKAYFSTKNKKLLGTFFAYYNNESEDEDLRLECFIGLLKVSGLEISEIFNINGGMFMDLDEVSFENFSKYLNEVNDLIG